MVRLAAWIRGRLSSSVREANAQRLAWATELARTIDARVQRVDHAGNTLVLELLMDTLPASEALWRWLDQVREAQAETP